LANVGKAGLKLIKNPNFHLGLMVAAIPTAIEIRKLKKQTQEKELLLTRALAKQDAVIKALDAKSEISSERHERLLAYDTQLKKDIYNYQLEIQELKDKVAELEKKKNEDE